MPGSLRRGEGRPSRVSSMVAALLLLLAASTPGSTSDFANRIPSIEEQTGARIGVAALDTGSGKRLDYRSEERFPMCSTFKFLAAAAVLKRVDGDKRNWTDSYRMAQKTSRNMHPSQKPISRTAA